MKLKKSRGFTLVELLIVVAIIGIIAAIAIPNLLNALNRAKQKRSMIDMRNIAAAWEAREVDVGHYTAAGASTFVWPTLTISYPTMYAFLSPTYARSVPPNDGWGNPYEFGVRDPDLGSQTYAIRSAGRDGIFSGPTYPAGAVRYFDCDIIYANGAFLTFPEGASN